MKKLFSILLLAAMMLPAFAADRQKSVRVEKNLSIFNDVLRQVDIWYVDTLNYENLTKTAIAAMLKKVDPYTVYFSKEEEDELKRFTTGKYGGIGAMIMQLDSQTIAISQPYEGLPAQKNDVRAGDILLEVNGEKCSGKTTSEVSNMLRGKPGTTVKLKLQREGVEKPIVKEFLREDIKMPTIGYCQMLNDSVGYVEFSEFTENSSQELRRSLEWLCANQECRHVIIDLRANGGGLISEALNIASMFLPIGTEVVTTKAKMESDNHSYKTVSNPIFPNLGLTLLVDENTASASEIICGSFQDLHRATLIGTQTFGKGLVQSMRSITGKGTLKVTTAKYYLPSGRCIQGTGVTPDIIVEEDSTEKVNIAYSLYRKNMYYLYANKYQQLHDSIPALDTRIDQSSEGIFFRLDSADLADFEAFLQEKNFVYETETSRYFNDLLRFAAQEDLDEATVESMKALQKQMTSDYHAALWKHKDEVLHQLEMEIVARYYYQTGMATVALRTDKVLLRALEEINKK